MVEVVVCKTRTSYSRSSAMVLSYQVVAPEEVVVHSGVVRLAALVASSRPRAHWHSGEAEGGYWS